MAENGREFLEQSKSQVDKDTRLRTLKDRQNEERQRKLEEIRAQAFAAQRFKEQKEQERRKRLEDLRLRDDAKRHQVEERKKAINEAERDRLEFIIKRNQEREHRLDTKKRNERSNAVFAFGSSTPRMLEPSDMTPSFWGHRRATSTQNITCASNSATSLTRRQSERDFDVGNKKRATSATGLERTGEGTVPVVPAGCASGYIGRRRTDLIPTIPTKDTSFHSSRKSLNHSPGRAYSMTRLDQLAKPRRRPDLPSLAEAANPFDPRPLSSSSRVSPITRSMSHLAVSKSGQAPAARRNLSKADSRSLHQLAGEGAFVVPRTTRTSQLREQKLHASANCSEASSRPSSSLSQQSTNSVTSSVSVRHRLATTPRKPRPVSIAVTGVTQDNKPPLPKTRKSLSKSGSITERVTLKNKAKSPVENVSKTVKNIVVQSVAGKDASQQKPPDIASQQKPEGTEESRVHPAENVPTPSGNLKEDSNKENVPENEKSDIIELVSESKTVIKEEIVKEKKNLVELEKLSSGDEKQDLPKDTPEEPVKKQVTESVEESKKEEIREKVLESANNNKSSEVSKDSVTDHPNNSENPENTSMTASMIKVRITTEEEAKAALAEKRRLIREEAERQAEIERLRAEAEAQAELERQQREEEQVRQLIELQRQTEQERLQEAIREVQRREEEERLKREEEQRLKQLKEEAEKKARDDAERQKAELQERLKNEEKEREARRKRVEAIMLRTRGKNNANSPSQQSTEDKNENKSEEENKSAEENKVNGTKLVEQQENGTTKNDKDEEIVDNIIPSEIVKNANTVTIDSMNTSDSINSNNSWRDSQQYGNFVINNNS